MKFLKLNKNDYLVCFGFFLVGIITRAPLIEKMQSHWDGSLFSIAVVRYSIEKNTPPTPGHPLYIAFGHVFNYFTQDPHVAILFVSVLFSGVSAVAFYVAGKIMYNRIVGLIAALIFLSGSTFYYFGLTPYSFILLPTYWSLIGAYGYSYLFKKKLPGAILGFLYALGIGIRPQEALFLTPLIVYLFFRIDKKDKKTFIITFFFSFLIWFIPFLKIVGGFRNYFTNDIISVLNSKTNVYSIGLHHSDIELMVKGFISSLGLGGLFLLYYVTHLNHLKLSKNREIFLFYSVWILPSLLFNLFVLSVHAGYQMDYLVALVLLCSYAIFKIFKNHKQWLIASIAVIISFNLFLFFWNRDPQYVKPYRPTSFHYTDIRKNDLKLGSKVEFIQKNFSPKSTIIITTSTLWSPYMYHLRQYYQYSIEALFTENKRFADTRRDSFDWHTREYRTKSREFTVPSRVTHLILVDDEYKIQLQGLENKIYFLPGNSKITVISVNPGERIIYGYRMLRKGNTQELL